MAGPHKSLLWYSRGYSCLCIMSDKVKCNFSIEHILNVAGGIKTNNAMGGVRFDWLHCTRYKPPKLQRLKKKEGLQRRKPGRNPRIPFSSSQVALLEAKFLQTPYLSSSDVAQLASCLRLSESRVKIWFQNRRARERREKESNFGLLKNSTNVDDPIRSTDTSDSVTSIESEKEETQAKDTSFENQCWPQYFPVVRQLGDIKSMSLLFPIPINETTILSRQYHAGKFY